MVDMTLRQFAARMAFIAKASEVGQTAALAKIAGMMQTEAKGLIGHEDVSGSGPFRPWAPLADDTVKAKSKKGQTGRVSRTDPLLGTGGFRESIQKDSDHTDAVVGSDDPVAVYHEFGTSKMPARSTIGMALSRVAPEAVSVAAAHILGPLLYNGRKP